MRILILSWYFPPGNDVAALRTGKLADALQGSGNEVWILTAVRQHRDQSLSTKIAPEQVIRTSWFDVNTFRFFRQRGRTGNNPGALAYPARRAKGRSSVRRRLSSAITETYMHLVQIPDRQIGWLPFLRRAGCRLMRERKFDLIYASGPPFSTFTAAKFLGRRFSVPWVAEYRDAWSRYVYAPRPAWREAIDEWIENRTTPTAAGIVTVSDRWADYYRERFSIRTIDIYNGFDEEDLLPDLPHGIATREPLSIVYIGSLYGGLRDPSVLYEAIKRSGLSPRDIRIRYYGPTPEEIYPLATKCGVDAFITVEERVSFRKSLEIQRTADVLLLLQSPDDPRNVPAKLFEYFASRRPILGIGLDSGIPARMIADRAAGLYATDAAVVAAQIRRWATQKKAAGLIPDLPQSVYFGLSRQEQFRRLMDFLHAIAQRHCTGTKTKS